jgi:hypothetical protein
VHRPKARICRLCAPAPVACAGVPPVNVSVQPTATSPDVLPSTSGIPADGKYIFFATCPRGLGSVLAAEVSSAEVAGDVMHVHASGVEFSGTSMMTGYAACMWLRTAVRVLCLVASTPDIRIECGIGEDDYTALYNFVRKAADWDVILSGGSRSFSVQVRESESLPTHRQERRPLRGRGRRNVGGPAHRDAQDGFVFGAHKAQVCAKDAICDAIRDVGLETPPRPDSHATSDVPLFLALHLGQASLYRDMAGASLHKRGYRSDSPLHRSSLNEAVAAGMLYLAGFQPDGSFRLVTKRAHSSLIDSGIDEMGAVQAIEKKKMKLVVME